MPEIDWVTLFKFGLVTMALLSTLVGALIWIMKRAFKAIDLLFSKYDKLAAMQEKIKLAMVAVDPSKTQMFEAFLRDDGPSR